MASPRSAPFRTGEEAVARVAADPFWAVVRRRHPDVDVVVLPASDAGRPTPTEVAAVPEVDPDTGPGWAEDRAGRWWSALVGGAPSEAGSRWTGGRAPGTSRVETTLRLDGADPTAGVAAVSRAAEALGSDGWHVLAPDDGLPRVLAGRGEGLGREELQLVLAPAEGRLVLRYRSADVRPAGAGEERPA